MILSYRTRRNLRRTGKFALIAGVIAAILWVLWMVWVARYMYYHRDLGAQLDFNLPPIPQGNLAIQPTLPPAPDIFEVDPTPDDGSAPEVAKNSIQGYYLTDADLTADKLPALIEKLDTLPAGTAVMIDVKAPKGWFYYTTDMDNDYEDLAPSRSLSPQQMNELAQHLDDRGLHLIARLPAFRDYWFGRYYVSQGCGLPEKDKGGALWMDDTGCYWLDPTSKDVQFYLMNIARELQGMGFDEVVYYDFRFPDTNKIVFNGDKDEAIATAAMQVATACATDNFCVSFEVDNPAFPLPEGNCRVYLRNVAASDAESVASQVPTTNARLHVLFITTASDASDTRFNKYCILRPMESAH